MSSYLTGREALEKVFPAVASDEGQTEAHVGSLDPARVLDQTANGALEQLARWLELHPQRLGDTVADLIDDQ